MWKTVSINPKYEVNEQGQVRHKATGHIKVTKTDRYGYEVLCLSVNHFKKQYPTVHRLVAQAFIPNPDGLPQVNHKDENKHNNNADNLEWCTNDYNLSYGTGQARSGISRQRKAVAYKDGVRVKEFESVKAAAAAMGATGSQISAAICGKQRTCRGYEWRRE